MSLALPGLAFSKTWHWRWLACGLASPFGLILFDIDIGLWIHIGTWTGLAFGFRNGIGILPWDSAQAVFVQQDILIYSHETKLQELFTSCADNQPSKATKTHAKNIFDTRFLGLD